MTIASVILIGLAFAAILLSGMAIRDVTTGIHEQLRIEQSRNRSIQSSTALGDASDYLTGEAWQFVTSRNPLHLYNYWKEVLETQRREKALAELPALGLAPREQALLEGAKAQSDDLVHPETRAMRLVAESLGIPEADMPEPVAALRLTPDEEALSPQAKQTRAGQYLFNEGYAYGKQHIKNAIIQFRELVDSRKSRELLAIEGRTQDMMNMALAYVLSLLLLLGVAVGLFYMLVTRPFRAYAWALKRLDGTGFPPLVPQGSRKRGPSPKPSTTSTPHGPPRNGGWKTNSSASTWRSRTRRASCTNTTPPPTSTGGTARWRTATTGGGTIWSASSPTTCAGMWARWWRSRSSRPCSN